MKPRRLGNVSIPDEELIKDKKECKKIGPCGIGKKAVYLSSFYIDRRYYIPISSVKRIFKRIAMSKGGFTGKGVFGTLSYLVVVYEDGKEKQCIGRNKKMSREAGTGRTVSEKAIGYLYGLESVGEEKAYL